MRVTRELGIPKRLALGSYSVGTQAQIASRASGATREEGARLLAELTSSRSARLGTGLAL